MLPRHSIRMRKAIASCLVLTILSSITAAAQQPDRAKRPRIGVALAGGAALGLTHVGVLKWLHDNRIPIDYVAGTSMGGLVGGMFAAGYTPAEVEAFVGNVNWSMAFQTSAPFKDLAFRRKEDQREYPNPIEFGLRDGISLPSGLNSGHGVSLIISRFAAPYGDMRSFDDLPTPFRAVSTDLVKAQEVVLDSGSLPEALRATMSLPAIFAPVRKDGMMLVDGGLTNNLPVDVVRKMGADIIIAVALNLPQPDPKEVAGLFGVARRSLSVMVIENERRNLGLADLVVMPDLEGVTAASFDQWSEFVKRGYEGAEQKRTMLSKLAVSQDEYDQWLKARADHRRPTSVKPQIIEVDTQLAPKRRDALIDAVASDPQQPVDPDVLETELTKIIGMGRYDSATYSYIHRGDLEGIRLFVHEKDHGPPFLKPAITLDANRGDGIQFGIGARLTFLDIGGPASEWRSDFSIGVLNRIATEYYYRINGGKWFVAPRAGYEEQEYPIYDGSDRLAEYTARYAGGGADVGYAFGRFNEIRAGWSLQDFQARQSTGPAIRPQYDGPYQRFRVRWAHEGQDSAIIPTRGFRTVLEGSWVTDHPAVTRQYALGEGSISWARRLPRRLLFISQGAGGASPNEPALYNQFALGGPLRMSAQARGQLLGNHYYYGAGTLMKPVKNAAFDALGRFYWTLSYEFGNSWFGPTFEAPRQSGALGIMGETALGVIFFGGAYGDRGDRRFFFRMGRFF